MKLIDKLHLFLLGYLVKKEMPEVDKFVPTMYDDYGAKEKEFYLVNNKNYERLFSLNSVLKDEITKKWIDNFKKALDNNKVTITTVYNKVNYNNYINNTKVQFFDGPQNVEYTCVGAFYTDRIKIEHFVIHKFQVDFLREGKIVSALSTYDEEDNKVIADIINEKFYLKSKQEAEFKEEEDLKSFKRRIELLGIPEKEQNKLVEEYKRNNYV